MTDGPVISAEALRRLLDSRERFLAFLTRRVNSREVAEDILQAAYLRGIQKGGGLRDEENIVAWFYRILRNAAADYYRERRPEDPFPEGFEPASPAGDKREEICQCVLTVLGDMKAEYRDALETVELREGSLADLADRAGISTNNAAVRVHRAREALRKSVIRTCGACSEHGCLECHCRTLG